jgi:hypothetical protein
MDIVSQITVSVKPELSKSLGNMTAIKPGSTLKLKIIELRGDRALIDFGKFRATADIKIPVTLGEELRVRVLESGRQLKMSVISLEQKNALSTDALPARFEDPTGESLKKAQADLKRIINQAMGPQDGSSIPKSISNILSRLNDHFEPVDLKEVIAKLIPLLKSYLENSGVFFEKFLEKVILKSLGNLDSEPQKPWVDLPEVKHIVARDLKANLLILQRLSEEKGALQKLFNPKALAILNSSVNRLLSDITHQQGRAVGQADSAEPLQVFTYVLPLKEGEQAARLKVYYQKKRKAGSQKGFRISVLLSLDRLGDLRTDFFLLEKDLTITFFVKEDPAKIKLQENLPALQELLHDFFDRILLKVIVSEKKVTDFDREDLQIAGDRRVDLRI